MFQLDDSKSLHKKWWFHQTSIYKWLFGVPGNNGITILRDFCGFFSGFPSPMSPRRVSRVDLQVFQEGNFHKTIRSVNPKLWYLSQKSTKLHPGRLTNRTWKWWFGRWCSFSFRGVFSGSMLIFGGCKPSVFSVQNKSLWSWLMFFFCDLFLVWFFVTWPH